MPLAVNFALNFYELAINGSGQYHHTTGNYGHTIEQVRLSDRQSLVADTESSVFETAEEVVAGHNEYLADPSKGVPADGVLADVKARRRARIG